jgi:AcrR family transcriptional regulator
MKPASPRSKPAKAPATRPRDSATTKALIVDTATRLLADKGFVALGVNALAAAAGVDKQLIYYHFGGLDGVVRQLGGQLELWLGAPLQVRPGEPYGEAVHRLLMDYHGALRTHTLVQRLLAWEIVEPSEALAELEQTRSRAMAGWVGALRANAQPAPEGVDAPAINAVLLAGLQYLALREQSIGSFAGVAVRSPAGHERIARAVEFITRRVYATPSSRLPAVPVRPNPDTP